MTEHVNAGNAAFVDADYEAAVQHYTAAIAAGGSADAYSKRAAAQLQLARYTEAAADATASLKLQPTLKAHWRAGQACFARHQFEAARVAFADAAKLDPSSRELQRWLRKCDAELESAAVGAPSAGMPPAAAPAPPLAPVTDSSKIRHEWYQSSTHMVVSLLARGVAKQAVSVSFGEASVDVAIKLEGGELYELSLHLYQKIVPGECRWSVGPSKVELKLKKLSPGKWETLEGSGEEKVQAINAVPSAEGGTAAGASSAPKSVYSGSSRDWDAIDSDLKQREDEEKPEGEEALNKLFRDIYGRSDEATRRAMNKSFQTSGGTVLSTNWSEVGSKDYEKEKTAPDGQEWKKWG